MTQRSIALILAVMFLLVLSPSLQAKKVATLTEIKTPKGLAVDDTQLYITENATVFIYSLKDFKLLKKFGKRGEGPQEFKTLPHVPVSVDVTTNKIIAGSMGKVSYFTKKGEFINEIRAKSLALKIKPYTGGFLGWSQARYKGAIYNTVCLYDENLEKKQEVFRMKDSFQGKGKGYRILHNVFAYHFIKGKIIIPGNEDARIEIFDTNMKKLSTITLDQERKKVDADFKKKLINELKTSPETKTVYPMLKPIIFPDNFPVIADFFVDDIDGGIIYVKTWKREKGTNEFFTYDLNGKFIKRILIPIKNETDISSYPTTVKNGVLYQLVENEKEEWEFHASKIK